jgi:type II secretory pathway pseudopilin PulG
MKFKPTCGQRPIARRREAGFTLAEVLAALVFMAIVIPVAVQGIRVANLAGQVADRKEEASRVAERILNEIVVTSQGNPTSQNGSIGSIGGRRAIRRGTKTLCRC